MASTNSTLTDKIDTIAIRYDNVTYLCTNRRILNSRAVRKCIKLITALYQEVPTDEFADITRRR